MTKTQREAEQVKGSIVKMTADIVLRANRVDRGRAELEDLVVSVVDQYEAGELSEMVALQKISSLDANLRAARRDERELTSAAMAEVVRRFSEVERTPRVAGDQDLAEGARLVAEVLRDFAEVLAGR